jgi:hypothetical protein
MVMVREEEEEEQASLGEIIKDFLKGLGFEIPEEPVIDARKFRRLPPPKTPQEMRQRTTLAVSRYTLSQLRQRCPPVMTMDAFLRLLMFVYDIVVNKGVVINLAEEHLRMGCYAVNKTEDPRSRSGI